MTATAPTETLPITPGSAAPGSAVQASTAPSADVQLPIWLRRRQRQAVSKRPAGPRDIGWWVGVAWLTISVVLLCFVAHVTIFGAIQQTRTQAQLYQQLRDSLATATTPLGQLDLNDHIVASGTPVALIKIPKIGLSEVIVQGTSSDALRAGPGHRRDTVMPGQAGTSVIFGRQSTYGGPFGQLSALVPGDQISVVTGQGTSHFTVFGIRRPGDPTPAPLNAKSGRLELVTADGPALAASSTLYVDASLTGNAKLTPAAVFSHDALNPGENAMESDPNAVLPFLFALQWLVLAAALTLWLSRKWGRWQAWIVGAPVLLVLGTTTADFAIGLLPNLI